MRILKFIFPLIFLAFGSFGQNGFAPSNMQPIIDSKSGGAANSTGQLLGNSNIGGSSPFINGQRVGRVQFTATATGFATKGYFRTAAASDDDDVIIHLFDASDNLIESSSQYTTQLTSGVWQEVTFGGTNLITEGVTYGIGFHSNGVVQLVSDDTSSQQIDSPETWPTAGDPFSSTGNESYGIFAIYITGGD